MKKQLTAEGIPAEIYPEKTHNKNVLTIETAKMENIPDKEIKPLERAYIDDLSDFKSKVNNILLKFGKQIDKNYHFLIIRVFSELSEMTEKINQISELQDTIKELRAENSELNRRLKSQNGKITFLQYHIKNKNSVN